MSDRRETVMPPPRGSPGRDPGEVAPFALRPRQHVVLCADRVDRSDFFAGLILTGGAAGPANALRGGPAHEPLQRLLPPHRAPLDRARERRRHFEATGEGG